MTILYPAPAPVKSAPARRFGKGLLATRPVYRADFSAADAAWWAAESARLEGARFDEAAGEAAALARLERGLCC